MEKTNANIKTIINTVCISSSLICVALTLWGNFKLGGTITHESFIGIMATFIGICATIIVGFQIINILELYKTKDAIRNLKEERKAFEEKCESIENMQNELTAEIQMARGWIFSAFRVLCRLNQTHYLNAITYIIAIITCNPKKYRKYAAKFLLESYKKLDKLVDGDKFKSRKVIKEVIKTFLPDLQKVEIPEYLDNYDVIIKLHRRVISKIELL